MYIQGGGIQKFLKEGGGGVAITKYVIAPTHT